MIVSIEKLAAESGALLKSQHLKLVTAESCTGGGLGYWITCIPGSSDWFERGFITYSDQSKIDMLGVKPETITSYGAVSEKTAREMAEGALSHSNAQISIAITGIAGPTGGSLTKPIGTVWIALASSLSKTQTYGDIFSGSRQEIRLRIIKYALENLLKMIQLN